MAGTDIPRRRQSTMQASNVPEGLESLPGDIFYAIIEQVLNTMGFLKTIGLQRVSSQSHLLKDHHATL